MSSLEILTSEETDYLDTLAWIYHCPYCSNLSQEQGFIILGLNVQYSTINTPQRQCCLIPPLLLDLPKFPKQILELLSQYLNKPTIISLTSPAPEWRKEMIRGFVERIDEGKYCMYIDAPYPELAAKARYHSLISEFSATYKEEYYSAPPPFSTRYPPLAINSAMNAIKAGKYIHLLTCQITYRDFLSLEFSISSATDPEHEVLATIIGIEERDYIVSGFSTGSVSFEHYDKNNLPSPRHMKACLGDLQLENIRPTRREDIGAEVISFDKDRITETSVKNIKITERSVLEGKRDAATILQFGRIQGARNTFVLDFKYPLSPVDAFVLAMTSIDCRI